MGPSQDNLAWDIAGTSGEPAETSGPTASPRSNGPFLLGSVQRPALLDGRRTPSDIPSPAHLSNGSDCSEDKQQPLHDKALNDLALLEEAAAELESVLGGRPAVGHSSPSKCPLHHVLGLVARACHIESELPSIGVSGEDTEALDKIVRAVGLRMRRVLLSDSWWQSDNGPLLGSARDDSRPLALLPRAGGRYEVIDPQNGVSWQVNAESASVLNPWAVMIYRPLPSGVISGRDLLAFSVRGAGRDMLTLFLAGIAAALLGLVTPFVTSTLIDRAIPSASRTELVYFTIGLLVTGVSTALFAITRGFALLRLEGRLDAALSAAIWDRILALPTGFFRRYESGDLVNRAMGFETIRQVLSGTVATSMVSGIFAIVYFFQLFYYSWKLALVACALVLLACFPSLLAWWRIRLERAVREQDGRISSLLMQLMSGIGKVRVAGAEVRAYTRWAKLFAAKKRLSLKAGLLNVVVATWDSVFSVLSMIALFISLVFVMDSEAPVTLGQFIAFNAAFTFFLRAELDLLGNLLNVVSLLPVYERARPILETVPECGDAQESPGGLTGRLKVRNLCFRYEDGPLVLENVDFEVEPGQFVALVGPSGSGKSTLLRLLLGFERPNSGAVLYNGHDLRHLDLREVRRQLGVVLQDARLISGSIRDNILGSRPLSLDRAWEVARMAALDEDIRAMPMGMHTLVSEGGGTLSGGQVQRLMIARAIVNDPKLLFLDEATSALDNKAQQIVTESLERLALTRVVIAHRLSTIRRADRILVLDRGRLVQSGTFDELMQEGGVFLTLVKRQSM